MVRHAATRWMVQGRRLMSTQETVLTKAMAPPTSLSAHEAMATSRMILDILRFGVSGRRLDALNTDDGRTQELSSRWAQAMQVLVSTQAHCATAFGYEPNSKGVTMYRSHLTLILRENDDLRALEDDVWAEVLLRAFAVPPKSMSLDDARAFTSRVIAEITDNPNISESLSSQVNA